MEFSHIDSQGQAAMVDVSSKPVIYRTAKACGNVLLNPNTINLIKQNLMKKGDVLSVAKIAGIMGAKKTPELIPLCHSLNLEYIDIDLKIVDNTIEITSYVKTANKTGVEMEALTAVSICALTIYDMCKAVDKTITIDKIYLSEKTKESNEKV